MTHKKVSRAVAMPSPWRLLWLAALGLAISGLLAMAAMAEPQIGAPAPDFDVVGYDGNIYRLSDFKGKLVVLEWTNHECPFVVKHYSTGNMQKTQEFAAEKGAVWLTVISSAPGKQGHVSAEKARELTKSRNAKPSAVLLDESGDIGRAYGARTTPHMFLIDEAGILRYMGAIDDKPTTKRSDVDVATNYVIAALTGWTENGKVDVDVTAPYGCAVKY
jgi:peroxiredoxin